MTTDAQKMASAELFSSAILGHVESLTLILGGLATAWACWRWGWRGGAGVALGTVLSWVNFRWLKGSVRSFGRVAAVPAQEASEAEGAPAEGTAPARAGKTAYFQFIGRYVLLLVAVYVILTRTSLPAVSVFVGLFAAAAGVVVGIVYEFLLSAARQAFREGS